MELQIPSNKIYNQPQTLNLNSSVMTFVGENGCGKSAILESIFKKYLLDTNSSTQLIAFSSGNNESFSSIFKNNFGNIQRLVVDDLNYTEEDENEEGASERIDKVINTMYFDPSWVRFLIFFSCSLKRDGKVMEYLKQKDLVPYIGNKSKVSELLNRKISLSLSMVRNLSEALHIPLEILVKPVY